MALAIWRLRSLLVQSGARIVRPVSSDPAWQGFHEARELYYAGALAYRATSAPFNAVPLVRRSVLLLLQALAASAGVMSTDREEIVAAARAIEDREWVLRFPITQELERLDELERRFSSLESRLTEEENRSLERLIEAMPGILTSMRSYLVRRGVTPAIRERRRRQQRVLAIGVMLGALGLVAFGIRKLGRSAYDVLAYEGLHAVYFSDREFSRVALTRRDSKIDFNWGTESPGDPVPADNFSVRWSGRLRVPAADTYTFYVASDDGSRLFINDQLVVDDWGEHDVVESYGTVKLPAGPTEIRLEYFDNTGNAAVRLSWSTETRSKQVISAEYFVR